jgi:hypothetical protein
MINNNTKKYIHPKKNIEKFKNNSKNNSTINNNTNSNINEFIKYSSWNNENDDILKGLYELGFDIFKISKSINRTPFEIAGRLTYLKVIERYYMARGYDKIINNDNQDRDIKLQSIIIELQNIKEILSNIIKITEK